MNGSVEEVKIKSPLRMAVILAGSVFAIEYAIMILLSLLPPVPLWLNHLIDSSVLSVLIFPVIYYFVYRPMSNYIAQIKSSRELITEEKATIEVIVSGSQDAIIMIDGRGIITFWNPSAERIFGYARDEALDRNLHELIVPERFRNDALKGLQTFKDTGQGPLIGVMLEHAGLRKNGEEFYAEHSISAIKLKGEWHALGIVRDVTDRKQAEKELLVRIDELERFRKATVQREFRIKELRDENEELKRKLGIRKV